MGMSTRVIGLRDAEDPHHKRMVLAMKACLAAGVPIPAMLEDYFQGTVNPDQPLEIPVNFKKVGHDTLEYYDVTLAEIPADIKVIRFENSW